MEVFVALVLFCVLSVTLNILASREIDRLKGQVSERDDLIDDLRSAVGGGAAESEAWRHDVL